MVSMQGCGEGETNIGKEGSDHTLAYAVGIHVGSVEGVDTGIPGRLHDRQRLVLRQDPGLQFVYCEWMAAQANNEQTYHPLGSTIAHTSELYSGDKD
jgi:hypothetical protein